MTRVLDLMHKLKASGKHCSEMVVDKDTQRSRLCQSIVSVKRDGKWYCGTHDPEKPRNKRKNAEAWREVQP